MQNSPQEGWVYALRLIFNPKKRQPLVRIALIIYLGENVLLDAQVYLLSRICELVKFYVHGIQMLFRGCKFKNKISLFCQLF